MTREELLELDRAGMTLGSHSVTHPKLAKIPLEQARTELIESRRTLDELTGRPTNWLCYPSGSFNPELARAAQRCGYLGACSVIRGNRVRADQLFWLPRVMIKYDTTLRRFAYYFTPVYQWSHHFKNRNRWKPYL
jgi:peptidoglycan/xylan/chitin deacetylase (PgdA/CDA1 family)